MKKQQQILKNLAERERRRERGTTLPLALLLAVKSRPIRSSYWETNRTGHVLLQRTLSGNKYSVSLPVVKWRVHFGEDITVPWRCRRHSILQSESQASLLPSWILHMVSTATQELRPKSAIVFEILLRPCVTIRRISMVKYIRY
jgi:hypothetical protein